MVEVADKSSKNIKETYITNINIWHILSSGFSILVTSSSMNVTCLVHLLSMNTFFCYVV